MLTAPAQSRTRRPHRADEAACIWALWTSLLVRSRYNLKMTCHGFALFALLFQQIDVLFMF